MNYSALTPSIGVHKTAQRPKAERLGALLLSNGYATADELLKALALQRHEDTSLGQILLSHHAIKQWQLDACLSQQANLPFENTNFSKLPTTLDHPFSPETMLFHKFAPISLIDNVMTIAIPSDGATTKIQALCDTYAINARFVLAHPDQIDARIEAFCKSELVIKAEVACPSEYSCRSMLNGITRPILITFLVSAICAIYFAGFLQLTLLVCAVAIFLCNSALKLTCLSVYLRNRNQRQLSGKGPLKKLERVSILVPLFKEKNVINRLIPRLSELDYPNELLEIVLICEETDSITRDAIAANNMPEYFRTIVVPEGHFKTKPRAMNYALPFCRGSIIGVYDAEDAPQSDQIYKAVRHLQRTEEDVACVQARLDFFNQDRNWLSRCFTIEYAILFRVILRGLELLKLPIPLGGTSMFIKRHVLEEMGLWDAHNVTEDADLGVRLYRNGYRVECLDSTTFEEANCKTMPWVKQRSRWLKGFLITWFTHMRTPIKTSRQLGILGTLSFSTLMLGTFITYLLIPLILPFWLLSLGVTIPFLGEIPAQMLPFMVFAFLIGEPFLLLLGWVATDRKRHRKLRWNLPFMVLYWPLASFGAYKALFEVAFAPTYWDKTEHGLADAGLDRHIASLTHRTQNLTIPHKPLKNINFTEKFETNTTVVNQS